MAVGFDAFSANMSFADDVSVSHPGTASARAAVAIVGYPDASAPVSCTYGGVSMANITGSPFTMSLTGGELETNNIAIFFLDNVSTGTQTVQVTTAGTNVAVVACYTMTSGGGAIEYNNAVELESNSVNNPSGTIGLNSKTSFVAFYAASGVNAVGQISALTGWTERTETDNGAQCAVNYSYDTIGSSDVTLWCTMNTDDFHGVAFAFNEVVAAGANPRFLTVLGAGSGG